jgi:hypothetical protein
MLYRVAIIIAVGQEVDYWALKVLSHEGDSSFMRAAISGSLEGKLLLLSLAFGGGPKTLGGGARTLLCEPRSPNDI